jgi:hypothetical protein
MCNGTPSLRRNAKASWNRAIRRSEQAQINDEIQALYSDFDGDVTFRTYELGLTLDNARNLRSVDWDY